MPSLMSQSKSRSLTKHRKKKTTVHKYDDGLINRFVPFLTTEQQQELRKVVKRLVEPGCGVLDLTTEDSIKSEFEAIGLKYDEETRLQYLGLFTGMGNELSLYISGILMEEGMVDTPKNTKGRKVVFSLNECNILFGVKMNGGHVRIAGTHDETTIQGLDALESACLRAKASGAQFTSWEASYRTTEFIPSRLSLIENANTLARYAVVSQRQGLVPLVSTIVHFDGSLGLTHAQHVTEEVLACVVKALVDHHVYVEGVVLQLTVADIGGQTPTVADSTLTAQATLLALNNCLPPATGGVMLANSNSLYFSTNTLNQLNTLPGFRPYPIGFCFSHVIMNGLVAKWAGLAKNVQAVQNLIFKRAKLCGAASMGQIDSEDKCVFITNVSKY